MIYDKAEEVIEKHLEQRLYRYQTGIKTLMKSSNFTFN